MPRGWRSLIAVLLVWSGAAFAQDDDQTMLMMGLKRFTKAPLANTKQLRRELAMAGGGAGVGEGPEPREVGGVSFLAQVLNGVSGKDLPPLIDEMKARLGSGAILLIADAGGKAAVAAGVTPDLTDRVSAVDLVRAAVPHLGGKGGGGRPDMAQGGGKDIARADAAIAAAEQVLTG